MKRRGFFGALAGLIAAAVTRRASAAPPVSVGTEAEFGSLDVELAERGADWASVWRDRAAEADKADQLFSAYSAHHPLNQAETATNAREFARMRARVRTTIASIRESFRLQREQRGQS